MQIGIKLKKRIEPSAEQDTTHHKFFIHNSADEFALPCPHSEDYYAVEMNNVFLLSLIMNRFAAHTRGSLLLGILEFILDRWYEPPQLLVQKD